jgi:hypothetical protein
MVKNNILHRVIVRGAVALHYSDLSKRSDLILVDVVVTQKAIIEPVKLILKDQ